MPTFTCDAYADLLARIRPRFTDHAHVAGPCARVVVRRIHDRDAALAQTDARPEVLVRVGALVRAVRQRDFAAGRIAEPAVVGDGVPLAHDIGGRVLHRIHVVGVDLV